MNARREFRLKVALFMLPLLLPVGAAVGGADQPAGEPGLRPHVADASDSAWVGGEPTLWLHKDNRKPGGVRTVD